MTQEASPPQWFSENVSAPCESKFVDVHNCAIHYLCWRAKPVTTTSLRAGIIFVHGNGAHAHWWSFIAPFFTKEYDCIAVSNSGNGQSGWRDKYTFSLWAEELRAAARNAGFFDEHSIRCKPIVVAHSLGVYVALAFAQRCSGSLSGLVLLDEITRPPEYIEKMSRVFTPLIPPREQHEVKPSSVSPRSRFRLAPPQRERNRYLLDYVADRSVTWLDGNSAWKWAFDPQKFEQMPEDERFPKVSLRLLSVDAINELNIRTSFIVGDSSIICSPALLEWNRRELGRHIPFVEIRDCAHHLMFDQPLALVAAVQSIIAEWNRSEYILRGDVKLPRLGDRACHANFSGDASTIEVMLPWMHKSKM